MVMAVVSAKETLGVRCLYLRMAGWKLDITWYFDMSMGIAYSISSESVFRATLIGLASTIRGHCVHKAASTFARITAVKKWIKDNTRGTEDSNKCST